MRSAQLLTLTIVLFISACGNAGTDDEAQEMAKDDYSSLADRVSQISGKPVAEMEVASTGSAPVSEMQEGGYRTHTIQSTTGNIPMAQMDLPAHWNYEQDLPSGNWRVTGKGFTVKNSDYKSFMYTSGEMAHYYQNAGGQLRQPLDPQQVLRQDVEPMLRKDGLELIGTMDAPAVAQADQQGLDGLVSFGPVRKVCRALTSDCKKGDRRYVAVLHWNVFESSDMVNWGYYVTLLETDIASFEREKSGLLNGLASLRYNPAYFAAFNNAEQQKADQSWSAHNARMRSNQAAFDAQQRNFRENANATNDAIMGTYRSQRDASDRNQDAFINSIREERNAVDPYSGNAIKIDDGSQQYWMNQHGEYYGTDDVMHDPNVGNTTPDEWRKVQVEP